MRFSHVWADFGIHGSMKFRVYPPRNGHSVCHILRDMGMIGTQTKGNRGTGSVQRTTDNGERLLRVNAPRNEFSDFLPLDQ